MYLIKCEKTQKIREVDNTNVICDIGVVSVGDRVQFLWKSNHSFGHVVKMPTGILAKRQSMVDIGNISKDRNLMDEEVKSPKEKRVRKPRCRWSPGIQPEKKKMSNVKPSKGKKKFTVSDYIIDSDSEIPSKPSSFEKNTSITDSEEYSDSSEEDSITPRKIAKITTTGMRTLNEIIDQDQSGDNENREESEAVDNNGMSRTPEIVVARPFNPEQQLYGRGYKHSVMIQLGDSDFYCKQQAYDYAISNVEKKRSILARRLLDGVFKPSEIVKATLTGGSARAQGRERMKEKMNILHVGAVEAIISFTNKHADGKLWGNQDVKDIRQSLRTRMIEIKKNMKESNEQG